MYYSKLTIDVNALAHATRLLKPFANNSSLRIDDVEKTTSKHLLFLLYFLFSSLFKMSHIKHSAHC